MKRPIAPTAAVGGTILLLSGTLAGCSATPAASPAAPAAAIGIDIPRADSDFWKAYDRCSREDITAEHLNVLPLTQSDGDTAKFTANVKAHPGAGLTGPCATTPPPR